MFINDLANSYHLQKIDYELFLAYLFLGGILISGDVKKDAQLILEDNKPMIFGKQKNKGLVFDGGKLKVATIGEDGVTEDDIVVHDRDAGAWSYRQL